MFLKQEELVEIDLFVNQELTHNVLRALIRYGKQIILSESSRDVVLAQ